MTITITGNINCKLCYGKGYHGYADDDAFEVVTCDCVEQ